jgi:hypothetical protein
MKTRFIYYYNKVKKLGVHIMYNQCWYIEKSRLNTYNIYILKNELHIKHKISYHITFSAYCCPWILTAQQRMGWQARCVEGQNWTTAVDRHNSPSGLPQQADMNVQGTKYVRLSVSGTPGGWVSVYEFEVYGAKSSK